MNTVSLTRLYVLFFAEVGGRRVHVAGSTYNPSAESVVQQARTVARKLQEAQGTEIRKTPPRTQRGTRSPSAG